MAVIAMTREMGTLGKDVAAGLAERLGLTVVHHELVEHVAERAGMRESEVHRFLEGESSLFDRWTIDSKRLSRYTAEEVLELALRGNVLIRGWGATYLLRSVPHVICVRICAPMSFREEVLKQRLRVKDDLAAIQREIEGNDAAHNAILKKLFGIDWMDATLYAIVLNTARVSVDQCIELVAGLVQSPAYQETAQSRSALMDELTLSRVRFAIDVSLRSKVPALGSVAATVSQGKVTLTGAHSDKRLIGEAVGRVQRVEGVTSVESQITRIIQGRSSM